METPKKLLMFLLLRGGSVDWAELCPEVTTESSVVKL